MYTRRHPRMHSTPRSGAVDEVPVRDVTLMQVSPARREPPPTPLPRLPTFPARSAMPAVLRMISTAAALTLACIGRLPAARADLDSICATGIDEIFAEVAEQSSAELIAPGGCDAAAALALCDVHGTGGVCRDEPACTPELIQVRLPGAAGFL